MLRTSITVAAAALAGLTALSACGPVRMGSAAIVGDQTISTTSLSDQVANLQAAYKARRGRVTLQFSQSRMPQMVLSWMVRFKVREQMAVRNHIAVTPADAQRALAATSAQIRASGGNLQDVAVANGLPPDLLPELGRYQAIQAALLRRLDGGKTPTSQSGVQALSNELNLYQCRAAKSLRIKVNPQYGRLDYRQIAVAPAVTTLSAPQGGVPSPSPAPQVTPAC